jgi:hypothetical protein
VGVHHRGYRILRYPVGVGNFRTEESSLTMLYFMSDTSAFSNFPWNSTGSSLRLFAFEAVRGRVSSRLIFRSLSPSSSPCNKPQPSCLPVYFPLTASPTPLHRIPSRCTQLTKKSCLHQRPSTLLSTTTIRSLIFRTLFIAEGLSCLAKPRQITLA